MWFISNDDLILLKNPNGKIIDTIRKLLIKILAVGFKNVGFKIEIKINLKIFDFWMLL